MLTNMLSSHKHLYPSCKQCVTLQNVLVVLYT